MIGIYCLLSVINDKVYIGQSKNVENRIRKHISALTNSRHPNSHLQGAFDKYGFDNFVFSPMLECDEDKLDYYEIKYISDFDSMNSENGYNLESGGNKNKKLSEESLMKLRESFKGENNPSYGTSVFDELGGVSWIKSEINKGNTQTGIAKKAGVSSGTLRSYLKVRNLSWYDLGGTYSTSVFDKKGGVSWIKSEISKGNTQRAIAKKAGVSKDSLRSYLRVRNISWQDLGGRSQTESRFGTSVFDKLGGVSWIKSEISKGTTQEAIAKKAGVYKEALQGYLRARNLSWQDLGGKTTKVARRSRTGIFDELGGISFIKSEIRNGKSQRAIARDAETSHRTLGSYIKTRGYSWKELKEEALSERE